MHPGFKIKVSSETARLRALLIHSPDSGVGKVVPSKAQDWLFEDIVHLESVRRNEYDEYLKLLLYFLDPVKISGKLAVLNAPGYGRSFFKPRDPGFHGSRKVIEAQNLLSDILQVREIRAELIAAICAIENVAYAVQQQLLELPAGELSAVLISGSGNDQVPLFAPIPNLIFTRDIGIVVNDHLLLSRPAKVARSREALIVRYIFFNHSLFADCRDKVLEVNDNFQSLLRPGDEPAEKVTIEGGDVMVISKDHVLIGCSERTSNSGASAAARLLFDHAGISKITFIPIPHKRDYMHIDTLFTQVKKDTWAVLGSFSCARKADDGQDLPLLEIKREEPGILQFEKHNLRQPKKFESLEHLLTDISLNELGATSGVRFIYSGNGIFPFDAREQWTDSCNLLALKEGVVLGYDRNDKTVEAFRAHGFSVLTAADALVQLENGSISTDTLENTLIIIPSAELSRARGGFHCMSMPLLRYDDD